MTTSSAVIPDLRSTLPGAGYSGSERLWRIFTSLVHYLVIPLLILGVWELVTRYGYIRRILLPPPSIVATTFWRLLNSWELPVHVAASLLRVLEGFGLAATLGVVAGVAIGLSPLVERLLDIPIQMQRPVPPIAWIPLAILWFGIEEGSKVFVIFLGAFFTIVVSVTEGIRQIDPKLVELARMLETPRYRFIKQLVLPSALPAVMTGLRVGLGGAWTCVVAAELIAADRGVGYLIVDGRELSRPDVVIAGMIAIGVIGKLMDTVLKKVEKRLIKWR